MHELKKLPYEANALEPTISEVTIGFHYGKHHQSYVTNLNNLLKGDALEGKSLEEVIKNASGGIFNNAAQIYNHDFYWDSLSPTKKEVSGALKEAIDKSFGSFDKFAEDFKKAASTHFGSGWVWLVKDGDKLEIFATSNADTPIKHGKTPLLVVDVWEHAYYIDYKNVRPDYVSKIFDILNWDFAAENYSK